MQKSVIIIGAGVSGITTALVLQLLGYRTTIYTEKQFSDSSDDPSFASLYPSASVIPHSVFSDELEPLFKESQSVFYALMKAQFPGLSVHKHFEVFEFEKEQPGYLKWMMNPRFIDELNLNEIPRRSDDIPLHGWSFDCMFADWPVYFPALVEKYQKAGGKIITRKLKSKDIAELPASTIINCSGLGSFALFNDLEEPLLMRGHLIRAKSAPLISNSEKEVISYNYTPKASEYCDSAGQACDVYCYPREDGWILGGSRQSGTVTKTGKWKGEEIKAPFYEIGDIGFPSQIINLNRQIIEHTFGKAFDDLDDFSAAVGYRFIRNKSNGLRLEKERISGKTIYHNYGHGGAGVSLSWGCAFKIVEEMESQYDSNELKKKLLHAL
ncbi:MAG TPA: FAD-dependent oxidoreductase [Balneolaceae bacterium]